MSALARPFASITSLASIAAAATLTLAACSRPEPPQITTIGGKVTSISLGGIDVNATLEAYNPNSFDLEVKSFKAHVVLNGDVDLGTVTAKKVLKLPSKKKVRFDVPIHAGWPNAAALGALAATNKDVPYDVKGEAEVTEPVDITVPFHVKGMVTHAQLVQAAGSAIPKLPF